MKSSGSWPRAETKVMPMRTFSAGGKTVSVSPAAQPGAPVLYLNAVSGEAAEEVLRAVRAAGCPPVTLVTICGLDWNRDLAPWDSPAVFRGGAPFTGGASAYLRLLEHIVPEAERGLHRPRWRGLAGYSLAGLFAVYALYQTNLFSRAGSMSGSLWFPGFLEYVRSHTPVRQPDRLYFSLGDRESRTRSRVLQTVQQNTQEIEALFRNQNVDTVFCLHPGNHFDHAAARTAAGIAWLLDNP